MRFIRAIKIRTISSSVISEKPMFWKPTHRKKSVCFSYVDLMGNRIKLTMMNSEQKEKKRKRKRKLFFFVFSESVFQRLKKSFFPFSLKQLGRSGSKTFSEYFDRIGVRIFFYFSKFRL